MSKFVITNGTRSSVSTEQELETIVAVLPNLPANSEIEMLADRKHWVRARRVDKRWHVERRLGGFWTIQTLTPGDLSRDGQGLFDRKPRGRFEAGEVAKILTCFFRDQELPFQILGA